MKQEEVRLCGCGQPVRYETPTGMACNKYFRCPTRKEMAETIISLRVELARYKAGITAGVDKFRDSAADGPIGVYAEKIEQAILAEIEDSVLGASIDELSNEAIEELEEYKAFKFGWDGYVGSPIDAGLIEIAQLLVVYIADKFKEKGVMPTEITPGPVADGSINIEFGFGNVYFILTLPSHAESIGFYSEYDGKIGDDVELEPRLEQLGGKIASVFGC
ncbi:MAG: hypothetical protein GWN30_00675 [Gammaproteobacteria bacterium]|nr:hypothetical protein [Gammaproteobacteria bacterium]NIW98621.1 hypothetical protein [Phycisphaerae bacterium]